MKSITQAADELQISVRTVQRYIKRLNISTKKQGTERLIDENDLTTIKKAIQDTATRQYDNSNNEIQHENTRHDSTTNEQHDNDNTRQVVSGTYKIKAEMLQSQLEQMQRYIDSLNYDKEQLYKQIEQQQKTIDTLTEQLTTAQQLNAGNIKALLNEQGKSEPDADATEQEQQPQKKQGFFSRIFGRKNNDK